MPRLNGTRKLQAIILVLFVTSVAYAKITGPDAGYTDAPGDLGNCTACHDSFEIPNVGPGSINLTGAPAVYNPGQQYTLSITVQQNNRHRFGFQLTAIDQNGNRAGTLAPLSSDSQINPETGVGGRQYIEHTEIGTTATGASSRTWVIRWTAPSTDVGTVGFWFAGNAANDSGDNQGDYIYTKHVTTDSPTSNVTVALVSQPGGLVLPAGSQYMLSWSVTGVSNIDNVEVRYSTDDGATFPISNQVFFTTDPSVTSINWTIPNTPTTHGAVRVLVGKKSGDAVQVLSSSFTITGDGSVSLPAISSASASAKKLFVFGQNFGNGAIVELNGNDQATLNDDGDPSHFLRCKKGAKKIAPGSTVTLTVRNPDGTRSAPFTFNRPPD
ncbi:MAG TPA: choice-of-anchor V domain-containing protein [Blastocatellia bacterium]|nr:choice-of-anchor V domain-containing protein [Blastocatellia bacterium]